MCIYNVLYKFMNHSILVPQHGVRVGLVKWRPTEYSLLRTSTSPSPTSGQDGFGASSGFGKLQNIASKSEEVQISMLVYSMGDKAEDLLQSFNLTGQKVLHGQREVRELLC